jgi:putative membrane protein
MNHGNWSEWMGLSMIFWIFLLFIIVAAFVKFSANNGQSNLSAKQILEQRYARGEINKEEFERKLKDLKLD